MTGQDRFDRNVRLFGVEGQRKLRNARIMVVGVGGLGTHVVQQLSLLGVGALTLVDYEEVSISNKNRYVGLVDRDPIPGTLKVKVGERLVRSIDPEIQVTAIERNILSAEAFRAVQDCTHIFGCLDDDGPRFVLNDLATSYGKPYIDLASDVVAGRFGGRIVHKNSSFGCLFCCGELDLKAVERFLETKSDRELRQTVYGIEESELAGVGPSVVSINGVIASLAVTEFMLSCTGMATPIHFINYDGLNRRVSVRTVSNRSDCPYCNQWNFGDKTHAARYLRGKE